VRYVISGHALDRFEERYPVDVGATVRATAERIQAEVEEALVAGRVSSVCPRELWQRTRNLVVARDGKEYVWLRDKSRGYVIRDAGDEIHVLTVLRRR